MNKHAQLPVVGGSREPGAVAQHWLFWVFLNATVLITLLCSCSPSVAGESAGEIVSVVGTAEVFREGRWHALKPGEQVAAGAVLRTGAGSRAAVQLTNGTQLKLNGNSRLELKAVEPRPQGLIPASARAVQNILRVLSGEVWIRNSGEPLEIQTKPATATIRGTELNLAVVPGDSTSLAVLEGLVELSNPQGSVLVAANEQATAKLGEAPRKTVLLNPLDAVQWSLYYPGQVSFRDYPLTSLAPSRLQERAGTLERLLESSPQDANALVELGEVSFDLGKRKEAQAAFERAVRAAPTSETARTGLGWVYLEGGKPEAALREFRQVEPTTSRALAGQALALYQLDRFVEAEHVTAEAKRRFRGSPLPHTQTALNALIRGEPELALQALDRALVLDPHNAVAHSLRSNIYLVQNRKQPALKAAEQAIEVNPSSPSVYLALSAVEQAYFELESALEAVRKAVALDPENPQARIQEARLLFGMGRTREAYAIAEDARRLPPKDSMIESTWGFLLLARGQMDEAIAAFDEAIALDTTRGEPHLGMGLALFRRNRTEAAVTELRKAVLLESQVSLYQSYLGKAYYEVKNDRLADKSQSRAKQLDPRDPTPFFYDAIRLQSINRPVEALKNLQKSIELNDKRAVYRSRLLLDEDLAARSASLARIYDDLGFNRLAQLEATKSLSIDPSNYSAHRFLADTYANRPRHEIARVSELLQAQLLQPDAIAPVPPQLAEASLITPDGIGLTRLSYNEISPLFLRNKPSLLFSSIAGSNDTLGDEIVFSGVADRFSFGIGQFHYSTNGFRPNNELREDIYSGLAQAKLSPQTNVQAELRHTRIANGDLLLRFDPKNFSRDFRQEIHASLARFGVNHAASPNLKLVASLNHGTFDLDTKLVQGIDSRLKRNDDMAEFQAIFHSTWLNVVGGLGYFSSNTTIAGESTLDFPFSYQFTVKPDFQHKNAYAYAQFGHPRPYTWIIGGSFDSYQATVGDNEFIERQRFSPKAGVIWNPTADTTIRAASLRMMRRPLVAQQTLEPTQVAGFNQFFDDDEGTDATLHGVAFDQRLGKHLYFGAEYTQRDLDQLSLIVIPPLGTNPARISVGKTAAKDVTSDVYLSWLPSRRVSLTAGYVHQRIEKELLEGVNGPTTVDTHRFPFAATFADSRGLSAKFKIAYVEQGVDSVSRIGGEAFRSNTRNEFVIVDASLKYRLKRRAGFVFLEARNLLDEDLRFEETDKKNFLFAPARMIVAGLTMRF